MACHGVVSGGSHRIDDAVSDRERTNFGAVSDESGEEEQRGAGHEEAKADPKVDGTSGVGRVEVQYNGQHDGHGILGGQQCCNNYTVNGRVSGSTRGIAYARQDEKSAFLNLSSRQHC